MKVSFFILLVFFISNVYLSNAYASFSSWIKGVAECGGKVYIHHSSYPVLTSGAGGDSTIEHPKIIVQYEGCFSVIGKFSGQMVLEAGDIKHMKGFTYAAFLVPHTKTCANKYDMGVSTKEAIIPLGFIMKDITGSVNCTSKYPWPYCDYHLTNQYIKLCEIYTNMVGICAFNSRSPDFIDWLFFGGTASRKLATDPLELSNNFFKDTTVSNAFLRTINSKMDPIDCYPVPIRPMPPPFCTQGLKPKGSLSVTKVCEKGEKPVHILYDNLKQTCTMPKDGKTYSNYNKACVRIAFENPYKNTDPKCGSAVTKELLYTASDRSLFRGSQTQIYSNGNLSSSSLYGCNISDYYDLCYDFENNMSSSTTMTDEFSNSRTFVTYAKKENTKDSEKNEICIKENNIERGCVARPEMPKPTVSFCENTLNTNDKFCMNVEYDINKKCKFDTITSNSSTANTCPKDFALLLTNKCGSDAQKNKCIIYDDCCKPVALNTKTCSEKAGLYLNKKTPIGMNKVCLNAYHTEVSPAWCTTNCNRICGSLINNTVSNQICDRVNPNKNILGPLSGNQYCPISSGYHYRTRNPVENDLCVDIYPFHLNCDFVEDSYKDFCKKNVIKYCSQVDHINSPNHYKNFDECIKAFTSCHENPSVSVNLGSNTITCNHINAIMYTDAIGVPKKLKAPKTQTQGPSYIPKIII